MNYAQCAKEICAEVGGIENVSYCTNCATRLRLTLKNDSNVSLDRLKKIDGVIGAVKKGGQYQIIIGSEVPHVREEFEKLGVISQTSSSENRAGKKSPLDQTLDFFSGIFTPLIPVLTGAGMLKVFLTLLTFFHLLSSDSQTYYILNFMSDATFYFLPILVGIAAAKKVNVNPYMAAVIGAMLLHPNFTALVSAGDPVSLFGIPVTLVSYSSSVVPMILAVLFLKAVEPFADRIAPKHVKFLLRPLITMFIVGTATILLLGPIGSWIGDGIAAACSLLNQYVPWLVPTLMGAFMPLLVLTGMHWSFAPIILQSYATFSYEAIMGPGSFVSNLCQGAASLAVALRTKKEELKQTATSAGITALFGVTEPALFGVTIQHKKVLYCVMLGGAVGGLTAGLLGVVRYTSGTPGLLSFAIFIGENPMNVVNAFISAGVGFAITFLSVFFFGYKDEARPEDGPQNTASAGKTVEITSPVKGKCVSIRSVNDPTFSEEIIGRGTAVIPENGKLFAPCDGTVTAAFRTGHAIGITTPEGAEILIHVGIDTVKLEGKYFDLKTEQGKSVHRGDLLLEFDIDAIRQEGYDIITPVVVTNPACFREIRTFEKDNVDVCDRIMEIL